MKILEIRLKNLNSLYNEWVIDFTDPEYVSNGIFVLTGPTGAGKSTILDAICLALYGGTPRLGKITKSGNEIMSRQTGECYAEVLFETQASRFRCHWEQHRARKKPEGKLQDPEHQIVHADTGDIIQSKKSLVIGVIEEKTGMDFDRFTRSILLAQGGFDTFLKADAEQKSKILEQITGKEIYSNISCKVHERQRQEKEQLDMLKAKISAINFLEPEIEKEFQQNLREKQQQESNFAEKYTEIKKCIIWHTSIDKLTREINSLTEEKVTHHSNIEAFRAKRGKLDRAIKAASLDVLYANLTAIRKQQLGDQEALKYEEKTLSTLQSDAKDQAQSIKLSEHATRQARKEQNVAAPIIQKIRFLDKEIADTTRNICKKENICENNKEKITKHQQHHHKKQKKQIEAQKNIEKINTYLKKHAQDEWLISGLTAVKEQFHRLFSKKEEVVQKKWISKISI